MSIPPTSNHSTDGGQRLLVSADISQKAAEVSQYVSRGIHPTHKCAVMRSPQGFLELGIWQSNAHTRSFIQVLNYVYVRVNFQKMILLTCQAKYIFFPSSPLYSLNVLFAPSTCCLASPRNPQILLDELVV